MAFPPGITTVECTLVPPVDFVDGARLRLRAKVEAVTKGTNSVVWEATGTELGTLVSEYDINDETGVLTFEVPAVDQEGFIDSSGAPYSMWAYRITYQYSDTQDHGREVFKNFAVMEADAADGVNIGLLPSMTTAGIPVVGVKQINLGDIEGLTAALAEAQATAIEAAETAAAAATQAELDVLTAGAPTALNTLLEFSTALGNDPNFATTITAQIASKANAATVTTLLADKANTSDVTSLLSAKASTTAMNAAVAAAKAEARSDAMTVTRLDRECLNAVRRGAEAARTAFDSGINYVYDWSTTSSGGAVPNDTAVQVSGNRLYYKTGGSGGAGVILPLPIGVGEKFRATFTMLWKAGGASDVMYFGIDTNASVGHIPALNSPDAVMIGMNSLHARSYFTGANMTSLIAAPTSYGTTPTVDTTYECTIEADANYVFYSMRAVGSDSILHTSYSNRGNLTASSKTITNLLLAPVDSRGTAGSSFGPITITRSQQPPRQKTVKGIQISGNDQSHFSSIVQSTADPYHIALPPNYDPRKPSPIVIFFHQSITGFEWSPWSETRVMPLTKAWTDAGYIVMAIRDNYDRYGNQTSIDWYYEAYKYVRALYNTGALFFYGASMGTLTMWNALSHRKWPTPAAVAGVGGAYNLRYVYDLGSPYTAAVAAAYGVAGDGSDYLTKTAGYDPILTDPTLFRGVPCRFYTSAGDTTQPIAGQNAMAALVAPYAPEATVVVGSGAHLDPSQYQGADCVAFFNRYLDSSTQESAGILKGDVITTTDLATMTNKRITPRVATTATATTLTIASDDVDVQLVTALAGALTIAAPTGTPVAGQELIIRIKDNATARALTWNAAFRAFGTALPTTTVLSKTLYIRALWNAADSKWDVVSVIQEV